MQLSALLVQSFISETFITSENEEAKMSCFHEVLC